jgi:hypothetical protein
MPLPARNLLDGETSPYLLQHKDNPVHWRPWGEAAFAEASETNRPVLLSIGYAACHWCHVMAHESFENPETAALMNSLFVNIKVDREERPDVDGLYQAALAMLGEHGGWPLTMFLTPRGEPFWGGTYFPPTRRFGRPAFADVCRHIARLYRDDPGKIDGNVTALREGLQQLARQQPGAGLSPAILDQAAAHAVRLVDPYRGGTAGAPKFPQPVFFRWLWRSFRRTAAPMLRDAVVLTLDALCQGGIYDHLGGGFARYSTDADWLVPHFEKMLYDNALLIELLAEVARDVPSPLYQVRIAETVAWAMSEMRVAAPDGDGFAFASALDADSEGEEGKYYVWQAAEIDAALGADAALFKARYDVTPAGNWDGSVILNRRFATAPDSPEESVALARARATLLERRRHRIPPGRDDKVLADWNGLMIAALVRAGRLLGRPDWIDAAATAFRFIMRQMRDRDRLLHSWAHGRAAHPATLEDYANIARSALLLHETTAEDQYLATAQHLVQVVQRHYWDAANGGYFMSSDGTTDLIVRSKSAADNAVPSGNGTMLEVLARLHLLTGDAAPRRHAEQLATLFSSDNAQHLLSIPGLLAASEYLFRAVQVVIVSTDQRSAASDLYQAALQAAPPLAVIQAAAAGRSLPPGHPAAGKPAIDGAPTAYVCVDQTCGPPLCSADALREALKAL